jgi:membrane protease YdiL (CAAX protease family)
MTDFFLHRNDEELGPYSAVQLHQVKVEPGDGIRHGHDGPWLSFSELLHRHTAARVELREGLPPEETLALGQQSVLEYSWPAMLLGIDALWLATAAFRHQSLAGWATALMLLTTMVVAVVGLVRREPWAWFMATLLCGAMATWMLAPLVALPSANLIVWWAINVVAVVILVLRRPRGPALDWPRDHRQLLEQFSADPGAEARSFHRRRAAVSWRTALAGLVVFIGLACLAVYGFHRLRYPGVDLPLTLMPRGADWTSRALALAIYLTMVVLAWLAVRLHGGSRRALGLTVGLGWRRSFWIGLRVCLALLVILLASRWVLRTVEVVELRAQGPRVTAPDDTTSGQVRAAVEDALDRRRPSARLAWHHLWVFFVALLIGPLCEELFFRGLLFGAFRRQWPFWAAAGVSSVLFALCHGWGAGWGVAGPVLWLQIAAGGLAAAYAYELTGSIVAPVVLHALWNAAQTAMEFAFPG